MKFNLLSAGSFASLLAAGAVILQQPLPSQPPTGQPPVAKGQAVLSTPASKLPADGQKSKDQIFAKCLTITNQEQVMLARYGMEKSTTEEVKELAMVLEKAHQGCIEDLKGLAAKGPTTGASINGNPAVAGGAANTIDFLQMHQELSEQCLKDSKEMLGKQTGAEFDKSFVGLQIAKHAMMHSSLTVLQRHATGELQGLIQEELATIDEHAKIATRLMEQLSSNALAKTAKNTGK